MGTPGSRIDRAWHVMVPSAVHGILESRAHRIAARRGRVLSDGTSPPGYCPRWGQKPTPPTRKSGTWVVIPLAIDLQPTWPIFELVDFVSELSDFLWFPTRELY